MPCTNYNQVFCNFLGSEDLYSGEADSKLWTFFLTQKIDLKQIEFGGTHSRIELHSLLNWSLTYLNIKKEWLATCNIFFPTE